MTTTQELLKSSFELNLNNYGPEDVERLNDWAISAHKALGDLQAEVFALTGEVANKAEYAACMCRMHEAVKVERAPLSDEQKRILFECVEQVKDGNELDYYLLGFEAAENAYGIKHGEGEHYEPMPIMRGMLP